MCPSPKKPTKRHKFYTVGRSRYINIHVFLDTIHIPIGSMGNGVFTYGWFIMNGNCFVNQLVDLYNSHGSVTPMIVLVLLGMLSKRGSWIVKQPMHSQLYMYTLPCKKDNNKTFSNRTCTHSQSKLVTGVDVGCVFLFLM